MIDHTLTLPPPSSTKSKQVPNKISSLEYIQREKEGKKERDMKEGNEVGGAKRIGGGGGVGVGVRSETEKEKTKMRERQRRAITTNIFNGLRKHGGYRLSPRADINEVLRELAKEAGWIVDPDGTTYRSPTSISNRCSVCGAVRSTTPTPTSSVVAGGGESSTPASPSRLPVSVSDYAMVFNNNTFQSATPFYISGGGGGGSKDETYEELQKAKASNQSTPEESPRLRS